MRRNARCPRPEVLVPRRGNSIVLVMGILVLLVIIATAFITRTQAGRVTSSVMVRSMLRDDNARAISEMLAYEIGAALFPFPVDFDLAVVDQPENSNTPRLSQRQLDLDGDGVIDYFPVRYAVDPKFPYNFAPYHVVPFTNWPDSPLGFAADPLWPGGPGNDGGGTGHTSLTAEGNPVGNPGFGDTRWLADNEPLRWDTDGDGIFDAFLHWRHMTNLARPNNGWRICRNISDITNLNGFGGIVGNLSLPVEQWLVVKPVPDMLDDQALFNTLTGDTVYKEGYFNSRWDDWFQIYGDVYYDPQAVPPNFYNLSDLNANGDPLEEGERPQDEFVGPSVVWPFGTPRWNVNRRLVDTDGDGFTDSFWFLAPTMTERGIRQIVAVRIIDNSAMLNANVATRFLPNDIAYPAGSKTTGATPADLALVGQLANDVPPFGVDPMTTWNVGFYDNPAHDNSPPFAESYEFDYLAADVNGNPIRWRRHLIEVGLVDSSDNPILEPDAATRLEYWQSAGRVPFSATSGFTPFTLADELELRMFHGQNYPWIFSRYEYSVQRQAALTTERFLRANLTREESSEYLDQLSNRMLVADKRRMLTLFNGARNDQMPPWLWLFASATADNNGNGVPNEADDFDLWLAGTRKFDLRLPPTDFDDDGDVDSDDVVTLGEIIRDRLERALVDAGNDSYYGDEAGDLTRTRRLAASLASNILAYRDLHDANDDALLAEVVAVRLDAIELLSRRYLGLERQPFLLEAFIGHVYSAVEVPDADFEGNPYDNAGNNVILEDPEYRSTVVAVQLANPFDEPIDLSLYEVSVFGQVVDLGPLGQLAAATDGNPRTLVLYVLEDDLQGGALQNKWLDFMDIADIGDLGDLPTGSMVFEVDSWSTDRDDYDNSSADAIVLRRRDPITGDPVVIDRIDPPNDRRYGEVVNDLKNNIPPDRPDPPLGYPGGGDYPGYDLGLPADGYNHWVQWVRVTRAWGFDHNADDVYAPNERNPRYVFGKSAVVTPTAAGTPDGSFIAGGNKYKFDDALPDSPWFTRYYKTENGLTFGRKPTFFDMYHADDPVNPAWSYPNKGWYGQGNPGSVDGAPAPDSSQLEFPMQMLQKDRDFEQVGEVLNVWLYGHELGFDDIGVYVETLRTFSEFMMDEDLVGSGEQVNRLRVEPESVGGGTIGTVIGVGDPNDLFDPLHSVPALPAGARVLDAFVCDDRGLSGIVGVDEFGNANGFTGKITPGLINVNTAGPTVLRSAPHMARLVHEDGLPADNPFVRVPEAIVRYRERFGDPMDDTDPLPAYGDRGDSTFMGNNVDLDDLRGDRGFASLGELMLLAEPASFPSPLPLLEPNENWQIDFAGQGPFVINVLGEVESTRISTDVNDVFDPNLPGEVPDEVAQDAEESNMLFAGMSNMLTTRSDVFTVYFRVRSFIQNPTTRVWDATNPEFIVDDSRYVMLVDRSEVNHPNDKPKILYLEKLPK